MVLSCNSKTQEFKAVRVKVLGKPGQLSKILDWWVEEGLGKVGNTSGKGGGGKRRGNRWG